MEEGLAAEVIVAVCIWGADNGYYVHVVIEDRRIHRPVVVAVDLLPVDIVSLMVIYDVVKGLLVDPAAENHFFEYLRSGRSEYLSFRGVKCDVRLCAVAYIVKSTVKVRSVEVLPVTCHSCPAFDHCLHRADL